jgi:hypothetical protein
MAMIAGASHAGTISGFLLMRSRAIHVLVLFSLLMQAVMGAVSPAAVICIKIDVHHEANEQAAPPPACHAQHGCCRSVASEREEEPTESRRMIELAPPCEDDCTCCVDVAIPCDVFGFSPRLAELDDHTASVNIFASIAPVANLPLALTHRVPRATGPPGLLGCPHRMVVRTTRLLI